MKFRCFLDVGITIVYMTCYENPPFDPTKFELPSYRLTCKRKNDDYCFETVPYLRFFYDHYYDINRKYIFVHGHEYSFHYNKSIYTVVKDLIKTKQFQDELYGPLYAKIWGTKVWWKSGIFQSIYEKVYYNTTMMEYFNINSTSYPCCSTFFVDSSLFRSRPREEYLTYIQRFQNYSHYYDRRGVWCGRMAEYTWHLMLGKSKYQYISQSGAV